MPTLTYEEIRKLLEPYVSPFPEIQLSDSLIGQVSDYLDLLIRWNVRVSLTAIRSPEQIIQRHFGESLFTGAKLSRLLTEGSEVLDYGSGPGFPGLPIQMLLPGVNVTVAESQARKVAFLREVIRTLGLSAEVWPHRVEELPSNRKFAAVTMRAVEKMATTVEEASKLVRDRGWIAALVGGGIEIPGAKELLLPGSEHRRLLLWRNVPRGTISQN